MLATGRAGGRPGANFLRDVPIVSSDPTAGLDLPPGRLVKFGSSYYLKIGTASIAWEPLDGAIGGVQKVEHKGPLAATAASQTFSGLAGNTDGSYLMVGLIKNATGSVAQLSPRVNGAVLSSAARIHSNGSAVGTDTNTQFRLQANGQASFVLWVPIASVGVRRQMHLQALSAGAAIDFSYHTAYVWNDSATEITSLGIVSDTADSMDVGSELTLYKCGVA